jgi:DNA repair protein RecO (recombination protein O)
MNQIATKGIVLRRTNYRETDRIITVLTSDVGKIHLIAKGVRKVKSKMGGGIELFSVSNMSFIKGRGEVSTLTSSRLIVHFNRILADLDRTMVAYDLLKKIDKVTEDEVDGSWFNILKLGLAGLDDLEIPTELVQSWFNLHILILSGYSPDVHKDAKGKSLVASAHYIFDETAMAFLAAESGPYTVDEIKYIRLLISCDNPSKLKSLKVGKGLLEKCNVLIKDMFRNNLHH